MNRNVILTIVIVLALLAGAAGIGYTAFQAGAAYGLSQSEIVAAAIRENPGAGGALPGGPDGVFGPRVYGMGGPHFGWGMRGWGGFGFLQCLFPLFIFFIIFALFRLVFRPWGWGWRHGWHGSREHEGGLPPHFEEWHKRAHGQTPPPPPEQPAPNA